MTGKVWTQNTEEPPRVTCAHGSSFMLYTEPDGEEWGFGQLVCPHGDTFGPSIAALAAERRATVERIRARLIPPDVDAVLQPFEPQDRDWLSSILDAEANR